VNRPYLPRKSPITNLGHKLTIYRIQKLCKGWTKSLALAQSFEWPRRLKKLR